MTKEATVRSMRRRAALEKAAAASAMPAAPSYLNRGTATTPAGTNYLGNAAMPRQQPTAGRRGESWMAGLGKRLLFGVPGMPRGVGGAVRRAASVGSRAQSQSRSPLGTGLYYRQGAVK